MSIYGPRPSRPPSKPKPGTSGLRPLLVFIFGAALLGASLGALSSFQRDAKVTLEIDRAESTRRDMQRSLDLLRLQTAELIPDVPEPPRFELPAPLQTAELVPPPRRVAPLLQLESAELVPAPTRVELLESADLIPAPTRAPLPPPLESADLIPGPTPRTRKRPAPTPAAPRP